MGQYIDKGSAGFESVLKSQFVDKTGVIELLNESIDTEARFVCVSRPRRFGKSVNANMIYSYYNRKADGKKLFKGMEITKSPDYERYLNKFPTIYIDLNDFAQIDRKTVVKEFQKIVIDDLRDSYPELQETSDLKNALLEIHKTTNDSFVLIIDEWDSLIRDVDKEVQEEYLQLLRSLFKGNNSKNVFALVYMTGILPILKYETQSALNNFREYSIISPGKTDKYYGFTPDEVKAICEKNDLDFELMKHAYDGYVIGGEKSMFNPTSVMLCLTYRDYQNRWGRSASYATVERYIKIDTDNVKSKIIKMLEGESVKISVSSFRNDMKHIIDSDDVLTLLVHLGYLSYDPVFCRVRIPNTEVAEEFKNALKRCGWGGVSLALAKSDDLLDATITGNKKFIAEAFDSYHDEAASLFKYNDENALACTITIAYYAAKSQYEIFREFASGKGFADMVFLPLKQSPYPAIVVELKYDKSAQGAIAQIKNKQYHLKLRGLSNQVVLLGINFNKKSKKHEVELEIV